MLFWAIVIVLTLLALSFVLRPVLLGSARGTARAEYDVRIYRDQLAEIEADLTRGVLTQDEAEASRAEISRRLLAAAAEAERSAADGEAPGGLSRITAVAVLATASALSLGGYLTLGAPGLPDQPLAGRLAEQQMAEARPSQLEAEEAAKARPGAGVAPEGPDADQYRALVAQLEDVLAGRPEDVRGHKLLAQAYLRLNRRADAREAQVKVLELLGDAATAEDFALLAEYMVLAADGYVSPEAEQVLAEALTRDPADYLARYYSGLAFAQGGALAMAENVWSDLLLALPESSPMAASLRRDLAGLRRAASGSAPGPTAADIAAAQDASPEDRQAMIEGMVSQLSDRLATEGGPPEDWARLIRAEAVLGRRDQATAIWMKARTAFATNVQAVELIDRTAAEAGLQEPVE
ncbi:MAG: c-type cytochrome biogenesis protein CcmI [Pseudomonadota bacterium]